jgi:hypothetical protein
MKVRISEIMYSFFSLAFRARRSIKYIDNAGHYKYIVRRTNSIQQFIANLLSTLYFLSHSL